MNYLINRQITAIGAANKLINSYHYMGSLARGCKYVFELIDPETGEVIGAAQVGICAGRNCPKSTLEIRRFVLVPGCPKNTASFFLGHIIRWFKSNTKVESIISYADQNENHKGTIYKAANFKFVGETKPSEVIRYKRINYHTRTVYGSGGQKVSGVPLLDMLKSGKAKRVYLKPKLKFEYKIGS